MTATPARILLAAAFLATGPTVADPAPPPPAPVSDPALRAGPMLAWMSLREAGLWVQTAGEAAVRVRVQEEGRPSPLRTAGETRTRAADDHVAVLRLSDLEPGTAYRYEVQVHGRRVAGPFTFRTQPLWQWRREPPEFTAMIGSCFYVNEPQYDRPGRPYGSNHHILQAMTAAKPDFMIWLGDNVYLREADYFGPAGIGHRYRHDRALPELQPFLASTVHYAMWDDHDYGPNDSDGSYPLKDVALETFARYWPATSGYGADGVKGAFHRFTWNDVDFFLLDDRYHRKPNAWPAGPDRRMLGAAQMNWLKEGLASSRATFKVVALGNQVLNPLTRDEGLARFPVEHDELLDFIREARVDGVIFLSGDRHHTELIRIQRAGQYPLYDFTSSPLTAGTWTLRPDQPEYANPDRVPGTLVEQHNFGLLRFSGPRAARKVVLETRAVDGSLLWTREIQRSEVQFPPR